MIQLIFMVSAIASGEGITPFYGEIPKDTALFYLVEERAGNQYVALQYKGAFITSLSDIPNETSFVDVYYDTPWTPLVKRNVVFSKLKRPERDPKGFREDRLTTGWKAHHYVLQETPEGLLYPVTAKQLALAQRAKSMMAALEAPAAEESTVVARLPEQPQAQQPFWLHLWGMHLLVALVGFVGFVLLLVLRSRNA